MGVKNGMARRLYLSDTMKKNRSNIFTTGLCNTITEDPDVRFLFFEIDREHKESLDEIKSIYTQNKLDLLIHATGNGFHFLSPTILNKAEWKMLISFLKHINTKCPMTTLRVKPNKYPFEDSYWYRSEVFQYSENINKNCIEMCNYLNKIWNTKFSGSKSYTLKIVHYPLPKIELTI